MSLADNLVDSVVNILRQKPDAAMPEVFDPSFIQRLAAMREQEYAEFTVQLEAAIIIGGFKPKFSTRQLDKVVMAASRHMIQLRSQMPATPLGTACPNAPHAKLPLVVPGGFWLSPYALGAMIDSNTEDSPACESPVYISSRVRNQEHGRTLLQMTYYCHEDKEWRNTYVPASASDKALVKAVKDMGVLVTDEKITAEYLRAFKTANWRVLPLLDNLPEEDLFTDFQEYILDHRGLFRDDAGGTAWGKFIQSSNGDTYLAILPNIVRRFVRNRGADLQQTLMVWRVKGHVLPDKAGRTARVVSFQGYSRRMFVFPDFIDELTTTKTTTSKAS